MPRGRFHAADGTWYAWGIWRPLCWLGLHAWTTVWCDEEDYSAFQGLSIAEARQQFFRTEEGCVRCRRTRTDIPEDHARHGMFGQGIEWRSEASRRRCEANYARAYERWTRKRHQA